jgi:hypothetical protein
MRMKNKRRGTNKAEIICPKNRGLRPRFRRKNSKYHWGGGEGDDGLGE